MEVAKGSILSCLFLVSVSYIRKIYQILIIELSKAFIRQFYYIFLKERLELWIIYLFGNKQMPKKLPKTLIQYNVAFEKNEIQEYKIQSYCDLIFAKFDSLIKYA